MPLAVGRMWDELAGNNAYHSQEDVGDTEPLLMKLVSFRDDFPFANAFLYCSGGAMGLNKCKYKCNRPFPSSCLPHHQSESKCEVFVMVISSTLHMNEN